MLIHKINDDSDSKVMEILRLGLSDINEIHLKENYSYEFRNHNSNLFYILANGRYSTGAYYVVEDAGDLVCCAGWNAYNETTALVLSRAYVSPKYRTTYVMGELLLPKMLESCSDFENVWITCNKYNKAIYNWFLRSANGKRPALFNNWAEIYGRFEPIGLRTVYNTEQYVVQLKRE